MLTAHVSGNLMPVRVGELERAPSADSALRSASSRSQTLQDAREGLRRAKSIPLHKLDTQLPKVLRCICRENSRPRLAPLLAESVVFGVLVAARRVPQRGMQVPATVERARRTCREPSADLHRFAARLRRSAPDNPRSIAAGAAKRPGADGQRHCTRYQECPIPGQPLWVDGSHGRCRRAARLLDMVNDLQ